MNSTDEIEPPRPEPEETILRRRVEQLEEELRYTRANEGFFRQLFENAAEGVWVTNPAGITQLVNPRMAQMLGYTPEEMIGRPYRDFVFPEEQDRKSTRLNSSHVK